jgi:hypothetical protein
VVLRRVFVALLASVAFGARFASAAHIVIPAVEVTSLGHRYIPAPTAPSVLIEIHDQVDFPCGSGPGTCSSAGFSAAISNGDTVEIRFEAPAGQQFHVFHEPGLLLQRFQLHAFWFSASDVTGTFTPPTVSFENLSGTAPIVSPPDSRGFVSDAGGAVGADWMGDVIGDFTFTAFSVVFSVNNSPPGSLLAYGPVSSHQFPSFATSGAAPLGFPDRTLMQLEVIPEPATGLLLAMGVTLLAAARAERRGRG